MIKSGKGGYNTTTGLRFERKVDFLTLIEQVPGYTLRPSSIAGTDIVFDGKVYATCFMRIPANMNTDSGRT